MRSAIILTVVGSDRPGLTQAIAEAVSAAEGNWLESHLATLAGKYVGSVLVEVPAAMVQALGESVRQIDAAGLSVSLVSAGEESQFAGETLLLEVVGQDRPGIVRELTRALTALNVNIESFTTNLENSSWSGCSLFRVRAQVALPSGCSDAEVREAIERISSEIMVDFNVSPPVRSDSSNKSSLPQGANPSTGQ
jgi:glycine cleavage system regulatory protein